MIVFPSKSGRHAAKSGLLSAFSSEALWIGAPCHATRAEHVQRWLLRPLAAGSATLALRDPELLGTRAQRLEVTLHVARQLELSLGPDTEGTVLLVCGTRREVRVDVRDAQGEALGVVNLQPLGLQLHSSDPGAAEASMAWKHTYVMQSRLHINVQS